MRNLSLLFSVAALVTCISCSEASANWLFSLSPATSGAVDGGGTITADIEKAGGQSYDLFADKDPNNVERFFDLTNLSVSADNGGVTFVSFTDAGNSIGGVDGPGLVGTLVFNGSGGTVGSSASFDLTIDYTDTRIQNGTIVPGSTLIGNDIVTVDFSVLAATGVPEPTTLSLFGAGLMGLVVRRRRK